MKRTVGQLEITTPSDREIAMSRVFDAPRQLVFDAWTKPELLKRWLGVWSTPNQPDMGMGGVYREIVVPERIVATEKFDDPWYEGEALSTTTFVEHAGKTTLTSTIRYQSQQVRDAVLKTPMETGVAASYDTLAAILAEQRR